MFAMAVHGLQEPTSSLTPMATRSAFPTLAGLVTLSFGSSGSLAELPEHSSGSTCSATPPPGQVRFK